MKHLFLLLGFYTSVLFSQERNDQYYFSITGDTVLFPIFSVEDSTHISVSEFKDGKNVEIEKFGVRGFGKYSIPDKILKKYNLKVKGIRTTNDPAIVVKEKIKKNEKIGFSLDMSKCLYEVKIGIAVSYNKKKVVSGFTTFQNYDSVEKKEFKTESFFIPSIVKMEGRNIYFVTLYLRTHHPALGVKFWEILEDFKKLVK